MADQGIKKATVTKADLPSFNGKTNKYSVRYRIVSNDKNRYSQWSPYYGINVIPEIDRTSVPPEPWISHSVALSENKQIINVVWTPPTNLKSDFDLYVKWGADDFKYLASIQTSSYTVQTLSGYSTVQFALQVPTFPKKRFTKATLFESDPTSLVV